MTRTRWATAAVMGAAAISLSACGQGTSDGTGTDVSWDDLSGRTFLSTDVLKGADPYPLVKGSVVRLSFTGDAISASGGCNSMGGAAHLDGDVLVVDGPMSMTEMACKEPLMAQDTWLSDLLAARPVLALDVDQLTLTTDTYTVQMIDEKTANPDRALEGTEWTLTGMLSGSEDTGAVSSIPQGVTATLLFADGQLSGNDGCNAVMGQYQVDGDQITVSNLGGTLKGCTGGAQEVESHVLAVLDGTMTYTIDGNQLSLVNGGAGLYLSAE
jgi:heat shock protein HslJ